LIDLYIQAGSLVYFPTPSPTLLTYYCNRPILVLSKSRFLSNIKKKGCTMNYSGYTGKLLSVDLTNRTIVATELSDALAEKYIGGGGAAAKLVADSVHNWRDPLATGNPLVFMTGPLSGSIIPWSGKHCVAGLSPLTGVWGESYTGGTFARQLKRAGYDGISITGKSDHLVYLHIADGRVSIEDAGEFAGMDTFTLSEQLQNRYEARMSVAAIGKAGENQVRFACVLHDGLAARAAGRCGFGALMGSKNLKAIAVNGSRPVRLAAQDRLHKTIKKYMPEIINDPAHRLKKAQHIYGYFIDNGRNAVNNWRDNRLEGFKEAVFNDLEGHVFHSSAYHCAGCVTSCVESFTGPQGRLLHWESLAPLGSQCGMTDMPLVQQAYTLCNHHGIDCISAGGVIAFAMECFEEGLLTVQDTDGIELRFGNGRALLAMLEKICAREGFGAVLAEGVREAARRIGRGAERFAIETKGLEIPAHDPRANAFFALSYATGNRGGCHLEGVDFALAQQPPEIQQKLQFAVEGTAERVAAGQDAVSLINSLIICGYSGDASAQCNSPDDYKGIPPQKLAEWFSLGTGMDRDFASLLHTGEVIYNLKHLINLKCGYDPASDSLHERFTTLKRTGSPFADHTPRVRELVNNYYRVRGWLPDARIGTEKLAALGLEEL